MAHTVFENSKLPLVNWFNALRYIVDAEQGATAAGLMSASGLKSYKSAWIWLRKLRLQLSAFDGPHESGNLHSIVAAIRGIKLRKGVPKWKQYNLAWLEGLLKEAIKPVGRGSTKLGRRLATKTNSLLSNHGLRRSHPKNWSLFGNELAFQLAIHAGFGLEQILEVCCEPQMQPDGAVFLRVPIPEVMRLRPELPRREWR